jgi:hypothetical protein
MEICLFLTSWSCVQDGLLGWPHACNINYGGGIDRRITAGQGKNMRPYLKNNKTKKDWEHGLSGRVLA